METGPVLENVSLGKPTETVDFPEGDCELRVPREAAELGSRGGAEEGLSPQASCR